MAKRRKIIGWREVPSPKQLKEGTGWFGELDHVYIDKDEEYCVMTRDIDTEIGKVTHMCIMNKGTRETGYAGTDISWSEKQRIKNEIFGKEAVAIEVFPKESELVDQANMYHLWVLHNFNLPFGI